LRQEPCFSLCSKLSIDTDNGAQEEGRLFLTLFRWRGILYGKRVTGGTAKVTKQLLVVTSDEYKGAFDEERKATVSNNEAMYQNGSWRSVVTDSNSSDISERSNHYSSCNP